jgi:L-alanine-DL-glutamate epimerase-like enolase superfamily enzyme
MTPPLRIRRVQVFPLAIPLRFRFEHAAATRDRADPVVVQLAAEAPHAQHVGYGETLARRYVTGETAATVVDDIVETFVPRLLEFRPTSFAHAVEFAHELPTLVEGRLVNAARCAVELAVLDLAGRAFRRRASDVAGWLGQPGFAPPGCVARARYSGIVVGRDARRLAVLLRLQRCYGLRDFKIKVAIEGWEDALEHAHAILRRGLHDGRVTLRADANGAWGLEQASRALPTLERFGITALEQPLPPAEDEHLPALAAGLDVQLGCLVGETSILSAAGVAFLEACPRVRFVEGAFGARLLRADVTGRSLRFGHGGRISPPAGFGLGIDVSERLLRQHVVSAAWSLNL